MSERVLLLSIKPEYANLIFAGTKRVELRRVRPQLSRGDRIMIYVTAPVRALWAAVTVDRVVEAKPSALWALVKGDAGLSRKQFDDYFRGATTGYAIFLTGAALLARPVGLDMLRALWGRFHPPRSHIYLSWEQLECVEGLPDGVLARRDRGSLAPGSGRAH